MIGTCATSIFDAQVPARHHQPIAGFDDRVDLLQRLGLLDFGDQMDVAYFVLQIVPQRRQVVGLADEGEGQVIQPMPQAQSTHSQSRSVIDGRLTEVLGD